MGIEITHLLWDVTKLLEGQKRIEEKLSSLPGRKENRLQSSKPNSVHAASVVDTALVASIEVLQRENEELRKALKGMQYLRVSPHPTASQLFFPIFCVGCGVEKGRMHASVCPIDSVLNPKT